MTQTLIAAAGITMITGTSSAADALSPTTSPVSTSPITVSSTALISGIDMQNVDTAVRPQDDFYTFVNGQWLKKTEIPADKSSWGAFYELRENSLNQLHTIVDAISKDTAVKPGTNAQKIADMYASFMSEKALDSLGVAPLSSEFAKIDALQNKNQIAGMIAHLSRIGVTVPYDIGIHQDARDSTKVIADLGQSGLGLPDRDYYLKDDDAKLKDTRTKYLAHMEKMLTLAGDADAAKKAADVLSLETALAALQWSKVQNRDPVKTYNKVELSKLPALAPHNNWHSYLSDAGLKDKVSYVVVSQPSYIQGFDQVLEKTSLDAWKAYFKWHVLSKFSSALSKPYVDENFAFYGGVLRGVPENEPRWKRGIKMVENTVGEGLGELYVAQYFPPENKARMEKLVSNLIAAYRGSIHTLDWMGPATKQQAEKKLSTLSTKIGYPNKWRDYSTLTIKKDDLVGNIIRANTFEYQRNINKLGKPVDRDEWGMTPQTVNAYYNPELNEVVFPAAILQPPFFNAQADDAVNYGGIGAVIGHEISHGFDDQGSQYDEVGNLRDWWTKDDHEKFAVKTKALVAQYSAYSPVAGYKVNGELTLGENIADNSGLTIAYKAYQLSLAGKTAPLIDGMTGNQRFYLGWAQVWRSKVREAQAIVYVKTDPHSPPQFRGNGTLANQPGFYSAFDVKPGDKMYLPPAQRVIMW
ncbi:M13 family metallopeptidase [Glaciimonas sp. PCH181]|uniref:M13 family metallopeptidase n=1 Tax=Glaciimonas sp. PCH181 TaxID=2133943 RepID=UPI000D3601C2|nr:M13 family metallopeptidase [Glaciimonas sp. PCH181]PUA20494.1 peptidase M13 [Glaciimonas sp. PCH181]